MEMSSERLSVALISTPKRSEKPYTEASTEWPGEARSADPFLTGEMVYFNLCSTFLGLLVLIFGSHPSRSASFCA
jgi:hypothetical protein